MGTWWLDRYLAALNEGVTLPQKSARAPDPLFVYAALVFDRAGVAPGLSGRFQVLLTGDVMRVEDAVGLVSIALGRDGYGVSGGWSKRGDQLPDGVPVVYAADYEGARLFLDPRLLGRGSLAVASKAELVSVEGLQARMDEPLKLADRAEVLTAAFGSAEAEAMARVLYESEDVPEMAEGWTVAITGALVAAAKAGTADAFFRELEGYWQRQNDDAPYEPQPAASAKPQPPKSSERKAADKAAAATIVDVAQHKKLSEMSGFGKAGEWGKRLAEDLRAYAQGELAWAEVDKGVLLTSPPGGGKSTFAKALAAECGLPLYVSTYGDWEARTSDRTYVVAAMQKAFDAWRTIAREGPIIVFIDEIDSMGARGGNGRNEGYWAPVINAVLAFLDGAVPRDGVVVIAATNFADHVDPALKRPGRLDRVIAIPKPDEAALAGIVAYHLGVDPDAPETKAAARALRNRSPAEVEQACREARRMGRTLKRAVDASDLVDLLTWARPKIHPTQDRLVRVHEAGHAVAALALEAHGFGLVHVDAQPSERDGGFVAGGSVMTTRPGWNPTRADAVREIAQMLGGMAAERVVIGEASTGSESDLEKATWIAARLVRHCGMGETLTHLSTKAPLAPEDAAQVEAMLREGLDLAVGMVAGWRVPVLAEMLVHRPFMGGAEVKEMLRAWFEDSFFRERDEEDWEWDVAA